MNQPVIKLYQERIADLSRYYEKVFVKDRNKMIQEALLSENLQKELKAVKFKSFLYKAGTFLGVLATSYLLIVK